jgi:YVTN family beta-propeller protein
MSQKNKSRNRSRINRLRPLSGLLVAGLSLPVLAGAQSKEYPKYVAGPQLNGSWVVGSGQVITPAGTQVNLGIRVRAKDVALNPNLNTHTAAVLTLGTSTSDGNGAVEVFDINTGIVLQNYIPAGGNDPSGSYSGIAYSADGKHLVFSQDSSNVTIANVNAQGLLSDDAQVSVPPDNSFIECFPNSPPASYGNPCGSFYSSYTSYPGGVALSHDGKSAYALLNQNDTLTKIELTAKPPVQGTQIRVGNAPHSIVINSTGTTAYVSNEGGRAATEGDFQINSAGTEIVADPFIGAAITGTVSVVDLASMTVTANISTGLHPTGMAFYEGNLLVANTYSDTISVINTSTNVVQRTISLGLPIGVPGAGQSAYGAAPNSIAVNAKAGIAYVALYNANAIGVVDLLPGAPNPVLGMIPVAYAPSSVVLDASANVLLVANDKGIGARESFECDHGVCGYNTHQDNGTVSIVPVPNSTTLATMTTQVFQNNHWDLAQNILSASGGKPSTKPVAIPAKIGDPSLIQHVFLIVRENRTYDQVLGRWQWRPLVGSFRRRRRSRGHSGHAERPQVGEAFPSLGQFLRPKPAVGGWSSVDPRGHGPLCRRCPVAGLGPKLSRRERGRCTRLSEKRLPVLGSGGRRSACEDLRRIHRERFVPTVGRVVRAERRTELEPVLRRLAVLRGRSCLRSTWNAGREDAVLPERNPGPVLSPGRA